MEKQFISCINWINSTRDSTVSLRPYADVLLLSHGDETPVLDCFAREQVLCARITPEELPDADKLQNGRIPFGGQQFGAIVVPYASSMELALRARLDGLAYAGILVFFVRDEPTALDENGLIFEAMGPVITSEAQNLASLLRMFGCVSFTPTQKSLGLRLGRVMADDAPVYRFDNTTGRTIGFSFPLGQEGAVIYDPKSDRAYRPQCKDGMLRVQIRAGATLFVAVCAHCNGLPPFPYK